MESRVFLKQVVLRTRNKQYQIVMKKILNYGAYLGFAIALSFTSCQDEYEEINTGEDQKAITANSTAGLLIQNTVTKDGSYDNIVDGTSCYDIKFPYMVSVNGLEITIDSKEDLVLIEEIFDEVDDDEDFLEIFFPITITSGDYTEITINGPDDLNALAEECLEGGEDDDIECLDFIYPMTLYTFDVNLEQTGEVIVKSDMDLSLFFKGLEENELVSFDFPITLELYDDTKVQVNSNEELTNVINNVKDACDEDDDNDYNDDDFSGDDLDAYLISCPWYVLEVTRDNVNEIAQYESYYFNFKEDGIVVVNNIFGFEATGTWNSSMGDNGATITLNLETMTDFNMEWVLYKTEEGVIKFYNGDSNRILMEQSCDDDWTSYNPETLSAFMNECEWIIKKVKNQGEEIDALLGYEFNFMAQGMVTLSNGVEVSDGTWNIAFDMNQRLLVSIDMAEEAGVSFQWPVKEMTENRLKFERDDMGYEMVLQRVCDDNADDGDVVEIRNAMMGGDWVVASYVENNVDNTVNFSGFGTSFRAENQMDIKEGATIFATGLWRVLRNKDGELKVYLNYGDNLPMDELTEDWTFVSIAEGRLELKDISDDGTITRLVLEK